MHLASTVIVIARYRKRPAGAALSRQVPGVTIVRPVCGIENFSNATLASGFELDYPDYEIIFCVAHADDPAVALVQRLITANQSVPARLLVGNDRSAPIPSSTTR